jgi:hypothetical protein
MSLSDADRREIKQIVHDLLEPEFQPVLNRILDLELAQTGKSAQLLAELQAGGTDRWLTDDVRGDPDYNSLDDQELTAEEAEEWEGLSLPSWDGRPSMLAETPPAFGFDGPGRVGPIRRAKPSDDDGDESIPGIAPARGFQ